ncbi:hypothetical protein FRB94_007077 [Tulasnella sp. JGI-2019a]|nr:hypothetical protein FRB94_007077 [Tulasnella sp. JGI-2019a]KAG9016988.1 hypothetical protein FRB93_009518 [Tulasnella sp. JGI-2019a]
MSQRAPRGPSSAVSRRQKPNTRASNQNVPSRTPSGFLDGLKSIVAGPLSWFGAAAQNDESDGEAKLGVGVTAGSKRRGDSRKSPPATPRKRAKRSSPPPPGNRGQDAVGGYLDPPPEVLRDSAILPNGSENRWNGTGAPPPIVTSSVANGIKTASSAMNLSDMHRPHRRPPGLSFQGPNYQSTALAHTASQSPTRLDLSSTGEAEPATQPNGSRRQGSVMNLDLGPRRGQQPTLNGHLRITSGQGKHIFGNGASISNGLSGRSPTNAESTGISRSPSLGGDRIMGSPERDRSQGPLRMGSLLRNSVAPLGRQRMSMGPFGGPAVSASNHVSLRRSSSSGMSVKPMADSGFLHRENSQIIFEPSLGITTVGEAEATVQASLPATRAPRNNAERILLALERATPLTDARRIRQKYKETMKVPIPGGLGGRTSRMLNPYGRPAPAEQTPSSTDFTGSAPDKGVSRAPGALRRYLDSGRKSKLEAKIQVEDVEKELQPIEEDVELEMDVQDQREEKKVEVKVQNVEKSVEVVTPEKPASSRELTMPGRPTSSLRSARAPTFRSHMPSSRPTKKSTNRFSANFADEDEEGTMEEEKTALSPDDLTAWAKSRGAGLEVPAGWNFNNAAPKTNTGDQKAEALTTTSVDMEKKRRDELVEKLVGGKPVRVDPFATSGPPMLPSVPSQSFFAKSILAPAPVQSMATPDPVSRPNPFSAFPGPAKAGPAATTSTPLFGASTPVAQPKPGAEVPTIPTPLLFPRTDSAKSNWLTPSAPEVVPEKAVEDAGLKKLDTANDSATNANEPPRPLFGGQPSFTWGAAPASSNDQTKDLVAPQSSRSMAPSPSPFAGLGKGFPSSAPVDPSKTSSPAPVTAAEPSKLPVLSFGTPATSATNEKQANPAPPPTFGSFNVIKPAAPAPANETSVATEHKPPPLFGSFTPAPPAQSTPVASGQSTVSPPPASTTAPASLAFSFKPPSAAPAPVPSGTSSPFQFTNPATTTATTSTPPIFSFGSAAKPAVPAFTLPTSASTADSTPKPVFTFGAGFGTGGASAPPSKPSTPPPQESDSMMDEGSPSRNAQAAAAAATAPAAPGSNLFSFTGVSSPFTSTPAATKNTSTPTFSFNTTSISSPFSNPFAPATNGTSNANIFSQPAPANPFASHTSSPFPSPQQQPQGFGSPAVSAGAFGSPQQVPASFGAGTGGAGFNFSVNTSGVNSPTLPNGVVSPSTTPAFVFLSGTSNPNSPDRPIKPLRRTGSTAARRGSATRGR